MIIYRHIRLLAAVLVALCGANAQAQAPTWQTAVLVGGKESNIHVQATVTDVRGNVFLTGYFEGTAHFGSFPLSSTGGSDLFVAKWSGGRFVWARGAGGTKSDQARAIATDGANVYVTGDFDSPSAVFGPVTLTPSDGSVDVFIAKLTDAGVTANFVWAQRAGGKSNDRVVGMATTGANVYVTGNFLSRTADFGRHKVSNAGGGDVFVAKLTDIGSTGNFIWAHRAGGPLFDYAAAIAVSGINVYVAGGFGSGTAEFGNISLTNAVPGGKSVLPDVFVAQLADKGESAKFGWAQRAGGTGSDAATGLAVSGANVYVTGSFDSGSATFGTLTLTNEGRNDLFIAKLSDKSPSKTPDFAWALGGGGAGDDVSTAIATSGSNVYVTGTFDSPVANFEGPVVKHTGSPKSSDMFLVKLHDDGLSARFKWAEKTVNAQPVAAAVLGKSVYVVGAAFAPVRFGKQLIDAPSGGSVGFMASFTEAGPLPPTRPNPKPARYGRR